MIGSDNFIQGRHVCHIFTSSDSRLFSTFVLSLIKPSLRSRPSSSSQRHPVSPIGCCSWWSVTASLPPHHLSTPPLLLLLMLDVRLQLGVASAWVSHWSLCRQPAAAALTDSRGLRRLKRLISFSSGKAGDPRGGWWLFIMQSAEGLSSTSLSNIVVANQTSSWILFLTSWLDQ